jgi:phosphatidylserine/phosphatidylglycerophosphate/cardiolipin synthase-like enzyme
VQSTFCGGVVDKLPDGLPLVAKTRVTVSEFPRGQADEFPPFYKRSFIPKRKIGEDEVPVISMGRYGSIFRHYRPSDDAFLAMFDSAQTIIRFAIQDMGPMCIPMTTITVPGLVWPKETLAALGRAIWTRGVDVEIAVSNPISVPGGLPRAAAAYGYGWTCVDVAAEIIKAIRKQFPNAPDADLRKKVEENLRVCYTKRKCGKKWDNGTDTVGMHAKHFIVDDICTYIGSHNLYISDLAEWGVVIDDADSVKKIMDEYWNPIWEASYTEEDCDVQQVMDGLDIDRDGEKAMFPTAEQRMQQEQAASFQT